MVFSPSFYSNEVEIFMIEGIILKSIIYNSDYASKVVPAITAELFEDQASANIFTIIQYHMTEYSAIPSLEAIAYEVMNAKLPENIYEKCIAVIQDIQDRKDDVPDQAWLEDSTRKWIQSRAVYNAIYKSIDIIEGNDTSLSIEALPELLTNAISMSFDDDLGIDYFADSEDFFERYSKQENKIPFSLEILNKITNGGIPRQTLNVLDAPINLGKTTWLIWLAGAYVKLGYNVVYLSAEVSQDEIKHREDVSYMQTSFKGVDRFNKEDYLSKIEDLQAMTDGRLMIKDFPAGSLTAFQAEHYIKQLKIKRKFVPDIVIVDYLGECASGLLPPAARSQTDLYLGSIAREFRAISRKLDVVLWSAAQLKRDAMEKTDVDMDDVGESITLSKVCDFMAAIIAPEELLMRKQALFRQIKSRYGDKVDMRSFVIGLDNSTQQYYEVDEQFQSEDYAKAKEEETKVASPRRGNSRLQQLASKLGSK